MLTLATICINVAHTKLSKIIQSQKDNIKFYLHVVPKVVRVIETEYLDSYIEECFQKLVRGQNDEMNE